MSSASTKNNQAQENVDNSIFEDDLTPDELRERDEIESKIKAVNQKLSTFQSILGSSFQMPDASQSQQIYENQEVPKEIQDLKVEELPAIDRRGNVVYSNKIIHQKFNDSWPIIRYMHLPYCYNSIKQKMKFWTVASFAGAYTWQAKRSIESGLGIRGIRALPLFKNYLFIFGLGVTFSFIESVCFEDYCDINSYHYAEDINRRKIADSIRNKLKN